MRIFGISFALLLILCAISARSTPGAGSAAVAYDDGRIFVTGGVLVEPLCLTCPANYETSSNELTAYWEGQNFDDGDYPSFAYPRSQHTAVLYNNTIVLFGGAQSENHLDQYSIEENTWTIIQPTDDGYSWTPLGERPSGRYGHGAAVVGDLMYVFGGFDYETGNALNDLWTFDFITSTWHSWEVKGWSPQPRAGFTFVPSNINGKQVILLFGGLDSSTPSKYYNDLWIFNTQSHTWKHSSPHNNPSPRAFHSSVLLGESELFIYGGVSPDNFLSGDLYYHSSVWAIDVSLHHKSRRWSKVSFEDCNCDSPVPRSRHSAASWVDSNSVEHFTVFAGISDVRRETLADVWDFVLVRDEQVIGKSQNKTVLPDKHYPTPTLKKHHYIGEWIADTCYPGYVNNTVAFNQSGSPFPVSDSACVLDCSNNNWCSGHGTCLRDGSCCCDTSYSSYDCAVSSCSSYRGFNTVELNEILLPVTIETTIMKLAALSAKLAALRDVFTHINSSSTVQMATFASQTYQFSQNCLTEDLTQQANCFEEVVGCKEPCGEETKCWDGDYCVNNECVGGAPVDCSGGESNLCVNTWCDAVQGCMNSTVVCEDDDPCTDDFCDPQNGCQFTPHSCDDHKCCTLDWCDNGTCFHSDKCEDYNPCTIDSCDEDCSFGECNYQYVPACFLSVGQNQNTRLHDSSQPRSLGHPIVFSGENVVPPQRHEDLSARGYFWLLANDCELVYDIKYNHHHFDHGTVETGALWYGNAEKWENAGVISSLPLGSEKLGVWNFCKYGVPVKSLLDGEIYAEIYFNTGAIRAQLEFYPKPIGSDDNHFDRDGGML